MRTSMLALGLSLLALLSMSGCKPAAGSSVLDGEGGAAATPFNLKVAYAPGAAGAGGVYTIDLGGMRSSGQSGGLPAGWRLDAGVPRFQGSTAAPFVAAGQPIHLQFELRLSPDSSTSANGASAGSRTCGGEALNPGGIELRTTSDGTINCDPAFGGQSSSAAGGSCSDTPPNDQYSCAEQAAWDKCDQPFMQGYCNKSCGRCPAKPATSGTCPDVPTGDGYTCAQQKEWGKCDAPFMQGFCNQTCGRCPAQALGQQASASAVSTGTATSCSDTPPNSNNSCAEQAAWGKCGEAWMKGYCDQSCGRCGQAQAQAQTTSQSTETQAPPKPRIPMNTPSNACDDVPPSAEHSCVDQVAWGKCNEAWMQGYCNLSCGRCAAQAAEQPAAQAFPAANPSLPAAPPAASCDDIPPSGEFTCPDQASWGKCGEPWMQGYCNQSCGRC